MRDEITVKIGPGTWRSSETVTFKSILDAMLRQYAYTQSLEAEVERLKRQRDQWRDEADPGWRRRETEAALDGEIRLLREQG